MQEKMLLLIDDFIAENGFPPTIRDLAGLLEIAPGSVVYRLNKLERDGLVARNKKIARSIRITEEGMALLDVIRG
jgi:Mn-dependent DtxR family transcriptional regulator